MGLVGVVSRLVAKYLPPGAGVLFSAQTRRRFVVVLLGSLALAGLELVGMGVLLLLLQQLIEGSATTGFGGRFAELVGYPSPQVMLIYLAGAVLAVFTAKAAFAIVFRRWMLRFIAEQEIETSHRLLIGYLHGPHWKIARRNTADLMNTMFTFTPAVYGLVVGSIVQMVVDALTIAALLAFLLVAMPVPTVAAAVFFAITSLALNKGVSRAASHVGRVQTEAGGNAWRATFHTLSGIKEIKIRQTTDHFITEFDTARNEWGRARATATFLGELPKYVLEVAFIAGVLLILGLVSLTSEPGQTMSLLALFVAAGLRLMPSIVRILGSVNAIRTGLPQMEIVVRDVLDDLHAADEWAGRPAGSFAPDRRSLRTGIELVGLHYRYPGSESDVIADLSLSIPAGHSIAFVGTSGAGKSTLIDLILGLHTPRSGQILVDGVDIHEDLPAWQRSIGLVPQEVFLMDDTLGKNITLGLEADEGRIREALERAQLGDVLAEVPGGLQARLGERGARVSGGQRQRIGIARALYTRPDVLVLDEATSALDNETERRITRTVTSLRGDVTTLVVAHRLSTIRHCDTVVLLAAGRVAAQGSFEQVLEASPAFAHLVELGKL